MAAFYQVFTSGRGAVDLDLATLIATLRALDASAGVSRTLVGSALFTIKKGTAWTGPQIAAAQAALDAAPLASASLTAQAEIDDWPISLKALVLALIDQINVLRAALPVPLAAVTPAQAVAAIRAKAGTL